MANSCISLVGILTLLQLVAVPTVIPPVNSGSLPATVQPATGPGTGSTVSQPVSPITLTLAKVVELAVADNTNVVLARQRLSEAAEGISQINAQGKPQLNSNIADTYSTFGQSTADFGPVVTNPVIPTGTVIPTVTDQAASFSSSLVLGGVSSGGSSFGAAYGSPLSATSGTLPADSSGATGLAPVTALPESSNTDPGSAAPDYGAPSQESNGPTLPAPPPSASPPTTSGTSFNLMPLPLILQNYVTEPAAPQVVASSVQSSPSRFANVAATPQPGQSAGERAQNLSPEHPDAGSGSSSETTTVNQAIGHDTVNNYGAKVNLSQFIDAFGLLGAARDAEKLNRQFFTLDVDRTQNEAALSAKTLFFNVILAEQMVTTEQEQVTDSTESVRVTRARVEQGQAAGFDLLSVQTTLANNQQLLTSARNQLAFAVANLDYLLGIDPVTPISLVTPPLPSFSQSVDLKQSTDVALQRRPELIQANSNIAMAQKLVKVADEGTTPAIGLVGTYGYNSNATLTGPTNEGLLSAQVAIPFDDGGATRSRVREAKEILQSQIITRDELKLSVALEVRQAYLNVLTGQAQASTAQSGVDLAVETVRVANVQYNNGVGTILDVENAQAQLATARTNLANADYSYQTALASLVRDIGSR